MSLENLFTIVAHIALSALISMLVLWFISLVFQIRIEDEPVNLDQEKKLWWLQAQKNREEK